MMPLLPVIDLFILLGWLSLIVGAAQKAIWIATIYDWRIVGLTPSDFLIMAGICFLFSLTLAARSWVKLNEAAILTGPRRKARLRAEFEDAYPPREAAREAATGR